MFETILREAGASKPVRFANVEVAAVALAAPTLLICDVDRLEVDSLEAIRRLRFVLPDSLIALYTGVGRRTWLVGCHKAGANCILSKASSSAELAGGIRSAVRSGSFTDARFARA